MGRTLPAWALALAASPELSLVIKVTVLLAISLVVTRLARRARAALRHLWLASVFGVLLLLPAASIVMRPFELRGQPTAANTPNTDNAPSVDRPDSTRSISTEPTQTTVSQRKRVSRISITMLLETGWALGALACLAPLIIGLAQTRRLRKEGLPWLRGESRVRAVARQAGVARGVAALLSERMVVPVTSGWIHPAIVLPTAAEHWTDQETHHALVHEIEHVRRCDWPVHVMARATCALYWFHPIVWIAWRQLCLDAERACDDAALGGAERTAYAEQLLRLAHQVVAHRGRVRLSMANRSDLAARVAAVLDLNRSRGPIRRSTVAIALIAMISCLLTIAPRAEVRAPSQPPSPSTAQHDVELVAPAVLRSRPSPDVKFRPAPVLQVSPAQRQPQEPMLTNGVNTIQSRVAVFLLRGIPDHDHGAYPRALERTAGGRR